MHQPPVVMESHLSMLSSVNAEFKLEDYVQPHYKESYRLAIDALVSDGRDKYQAFLKSERIGDFLSEEEITFITKRAEQPSVGNPLEEIDGPQDSKSSSGTYWPTHSDVETPDLELGWPDRIHERLHTNIDLLYHPPRQSSPTIKEVIRKHIQDAQQVIAIVMDVFTDVDIFKEIVDASIRGVPVYVLLDDFHLKSFLTMAESQEIQIPKLRNMRVRTVKGHDYLCRSGAKFHGAMQQRFLLVDCQTVVFGLYSYMWSFEKIHLSMVQVITGRLVDSYDEEFRTLFARSTVPAVLLPPTSVFADRMPNGSHAVAKYRSQSIQAFERKDQFRHTIEPMYRKTCERQFGLTTPTLNMDERLYEDGLYDHRPQIVSHGLNVQNQIHQFQSVESNNFNKRHSFAGERKEGSYITHTSRYGASSRNMIGDSDHYGAPGRKHFPYALEEQPPVTRGNNIYRGANMRQSYHGNDKQVLAMQQNLPSLERTSKSFLRTWRIESYLNNNDPPVGESSDYLDHFDAPENKAGSFIPSRVRSSLVFKSTIPEQPETNSYTNSYTNKSSQFQNNSSGMSNNIPFYSSMQWNSASAMEIRMRQDNYLLKRSLQVLDNPRNNMAHVSAKDSYPSVYASLGRAKGSLTIKNSEPMHQDWHKRHSVADPKYIENHESRESSSHMYGAFMRRQPDPSLVQQNAQSRGYSSNLKEDQRSISQYDVKQFVDSKSPSVSNWQEPPSRTVSAAVLEMSEKEIPQKSPILGSPRFLKKSSKKIKSLLNIPEKRQSTTHTKRQDGSSDTLVSNEEEQRQKRFTNSHQPSESSGQSRLSSKLQVNKSLTADSTGKSSAPRFSTEGLDQSSSVTKPSTKMQHAVDRNEKPVLMPASWRKDQGVNHRLYSRFEPFCTLDRKQSPATVAAVKLQAPERPKSLLLGKGSSTSEQHNHMGQMTHGHHDNKLGRFIQRVGNFIHKKEK